MAQIFRGRVRDTSTSTGTGSIVVSGAAITTYRTFSAVMATSDTIWAAIVNRGANEWEIGLYTYSALNTLARVAGSVIDGSSGPGVLVNFSAGTKDVFGIAPISATSFAASGAATIIVSDTPPAGAADNTLWWESDSGVLYLRYNDTTSTQWIPATQVPTGPGGMSLTAIGQNLSGGVYSTPYGYSTGSITVDFGRNPIQYVNNTGAFTITAPSQSGSCILTVINGSGAGAITFTGWTVGSNTGDPFTTTNGHKFSIMMWGVQGFYSYNVKALQ